MVIALLCDHRIMARGEFAIGLNEVQVGLYPGDTIHRAYVRLIGAARAASLLSRGALLDPEAALAAGLVDELAAPRESLDSLLADGWAGEETQAAMARLLRRPS